MQCITTGPYTRRIESSEGRKLGIATHIPASGMGMRGLSQNRYKEAIILYPDRIDYWKPESIREDQKKLLILGPYLPLISLEEVLHLPTENQLPYLARLAGVLDRLFDHEDFISPLFGGSVYFLDDSGVMILPLGWSQQILHFLSDDFTKRLVLHSSLPGRSTAKQRMLFAFGVLWYRAVTGQFPFDDTEDKTEPDILPEDAGDQEVLNNPAQEMEIDVEERKLNRLFPPPHLLEPSLPAQAASQISSLLINDSNNLPDAASLETAVSECHTWMTSKTRVVGEQELALKKESELVYKKRMRRFVVQRTIRKRSGLIAAAALGVVLVISIASSLIGRALEPPRTLGLQPQEVVRTFLESINTMDHEMMSGSVRNGAGSDLINSVLQIFATVQVRQAYEGRYVHVSPQQWLDEGKPPLPESTLLYGIANLEILDSQQPGDDPEGMTMVDVRYEIFSPDIRQEVASDGRTIAASYYQSGIITQRFILEYHRNAWFITEIVTLDEESP